MVRSTAGSGIQIDQIGTEMGILGAVVTADPGPFAAPKRVLLLQGRGLGDAVISTGIVNSIGASFPGTKVDILGRESLRPIFNANPHVGRFYPAPYPIAVGLRYSPLDAWQLLSALLTIRQQRYDLCINLVGDFRENLIGWLSESKSRIAPVWLPGHSIRRSIRVGLGRLVDSPQPIEGEVCNIYLACDQIARGIGCKTLVNQKIYVERKLPTRLPGEADQLVIGIHPFARQACRQWQGESWRALIQSLLQAGYRITLFGAATDRATADNWFGRLLRDRRVHNVFEDLPSFFGNMASVDILIGLDSFSIHAAHALDIPSVMLNGANDPRVWAPPTASVLASDHGCPHYPCFNRPRCIGTPQEFVCIRSISVSAVMDIVQGMAGKLACHTDPRRGQDAPPSMG
jgi:heptosyltransferase-3